MITKDPRMQTVIGRRSGFSANDIYKINKLYECDTRLNATDLDEHEAFFCEDDDNDVCKVRRLLEYCEEENTKKECPKSCGSCNKKPDQVVNAKCVDKKSLCRAWVQDSNSFCVDFPKYAKSNCPKSCGLCAKKPKPVCKDRNSHCTEWSLEGKGFCMQYRLYTMKHCAKTCKYCGEDGSESSRHANRHRAPEISESKPEIKQVDDYVPEPEESDPQPNKKGGRPPKPHVADNIGTTNQTGGKPEPDEPSKARSKTQDQKPKPKATKLKPKKVFAAQLDEGECLDIYKGCTEHKAEGRCEEGHRLFGDMIKRCKKTCGFC